MGAELSKPQPHLGTSLEELQRLHVWCLSESVRLDSQFHTTRSILLNSSALPASLASLDSSSLLSSVISHTQPLLTTVDALLANADPSQAGMGSQAIAGYSLHSAYQNMTSLASNIHPGDEAPAPSSSSSQREKGRPSMTSAHLSCQERLEVSHKYLVLQAMLSKMLKAVQHTLKGKERDKFLQAKLNNRRPPGARDMAEDEWQRAQETLRRNAEQMAKCAARLDAAKETLEWLYRDYRIALVTHQVNETLRVLKAIQRKWQGKSAYHYPRKLGMGDSASGAGGGGVSGSHLASRSGSRNVRPMLTPLNPTNTQSSASPAVMSPMSPTSPPNVFVARSTMSPLSPILQSPYPANAHHASSAFPFSPIQSPPQAQVPASVSGRHVPPPVPAHLLARAQGSQSYLQPNASYSSLSVNSHLSVVPPLSPPISPPYTRSPPPLTAPVTVPAATIQSMSSIYTSMPTPHHPNPVPYQVPHDVYDLRFWQAELEKRQRLLDAAAQSNERAALIAALHTMDESFTASVSALKLQHMSPRLVTNLQLQHKAFLYRDDLQRAIVNMNARLTTLDCAISKLKEEQFRLYRQSSQEQAVARSNEQMNVVLGEAATEKRACRDLFKFFAPAIAQHVYVKLEQEVLTQQVDVHQLYRELQKVERACHAMFGHVHADPPSLMFSLGGPREESSQASRDAEPTPQKVIVHYDKDKTGEIETARFSPQGVEAAKAAAAGGSASSAGGRYPLGALSPPVLSPPGRRVMRRIGDEDGGAADDDVEWKDDGRGVGSPPPLDWSGDDSSAARSEERKEVLTRGSGGGDQSARSSPRTPSDPSPQRPPHHSRSRSAGVRLITGGQAGGGDQANLAEFMRRRQSGRPIPPPLPPHVLPSHERKMAEERGRERDRDPASRTSTPSTDRSPDRHLSLPPPQPTPHRPQLPPRPRRAGSVEYRGPDTSPVGSGAATPPVPVVNALPPGVAPVAVVAPPSSPVAPPPPLPLSEGVGGDEPLMTLQQLLEKANSPTAIPPPPPIPVDAASPASPLRGFPSGPAPAPASPTLSAIPRRLGLGGAGAERTSPVAVQRRLSSSPSSPAAAAVLSPNARIPVFAAPSPLPPLSASAEAAIVERNTALNRSEVVSVPLRGMEKLSVREKILRLQQSQGGDGTAGLGQKRANSRERAGPVAPPRLSDSIVRRSLEGELGGGGGGGHARQRSQPTVGVAADGGLSEGSGSAPLPPLEGLPHPTVMNLQLSSATRELLQKGGGGGQALYYSKELEAAPASALGQDIMYQ